MSANTYQPTTKMTPREIAIPAAPSLNSGLPPPQGFDVVAPAQISSANLAGGYIDPASFRNDRSAA